MSVLFDVKEADVDSFTSAVNETKGRKGKDVNINDTETDTFKKTTSRRSRPRLRPCLHCYNERSSK